MVCLDLRYGWLWDFQSNIPIDELSESEARERGEHGLLYCAGFEVGAALNSRRVLEINWGQDYLGVWFFDEAGRQSTRYAFDKVSPTEMFLSEVMVYSYAGSEYAEPPESESSVSIYYSQDGRLTEVTSSKAGAYNDIVEFDNISVESNYEPLPVFGDWGSVARYNR
ncbi:hypothetical protein [Nocardia fluminea]|uniref:hypothetical protein n=1 Tax=Nocardia fluminea TaxID=134984 RepID=UPI00342BDD5B